MRRGVGGPEGSCRRDGAFPVFCLSISCVSNSALATCEGGATLTLVEPAPTSHVPAALMNFSCWRELLPPMSSSLL